MYYFEEEKKSATLKYAQFSAEYSLLGIEIPI
jgi:hypothetical protein